MKNKVAFLLSLVILISCNTEDGWDCLQTQGNIVLKQYDVPVFEKVIVHRDVQLVVEQGIELGVVVETGENLLSDIDLKVVGDQLQIFDNNTCNLVRPYGITKVHITTPDLIEIRNSSQYEVTSIGVLNLDRLKLVSENFSVSGSFTVGDFRLSVNTNQLIISANNLSTFYLSGATENLALNFYSGDGRFEGENLIGQHINVFHRGSNDMIVNPQQSLTGELRGTGDLISVNQPPLVEVEQFYTGQLIFQN